MEKQSKKSEFERLLACLLLAPAVISVGFFLVGIFSGMPREIKSLDTYIGLMAIAGAYLLSNSGRNNS